MQRHRRAHRECQIGIFLAYASGKGHGLIDREFYLPKEWAEDLARRGAAGIPEAVAFATQPELARRMDRPGDRR
jgi:SRSO17 transposase